MNFLLHFYLKFWDKQWDKALLLAKKLDSIHMQTPDNVKNHMFIATW